MKYFYLPIVFSILYSLFSASAVQAQFTEQFIGSLTGVENSSVAWGDYDNDGNLDILLTGYSQSAINAKIYRNTGSGFTQAYAGSLTGVLDGSVAWGDYDNDGRIDILITGSTGASRIAKIYRNTGSGFTEAYAGSLTGVYRSSIAWGDYDNDGKLDILLTGSTTSTYPYNAITKIYHNTGSGFTEVYAGSLTGVYYSSVEWGDYDNDGKLDIVLTGYTGSIGIAKIYRNTGSGFTEVYAGSLTGVYGSSVAWGDYDNDGKLDILLTGTPGSGCIAKVYRNNGSGFTEVYAGMLSGVISGSVAWGDYDNDGNLDILLTGYNGSIDIAKIYRNTGSGFTETYAGSLTGVEYSSVAWGDYDNDGKLDILITGSTGTGQIAQIYRNSTPNANTAPSAPAGLTTTVANDTVHLHWNQSTDTETPSAGLSYNLRLGTGSSAIDIQSPMADIFTGWRQVARLGSVNENTSWTIKNLPNGTFYWSVQAIDHAFAGSPFAAEGSFSFMPVFSPAPISLDFGTINIGVSKKDSILVTNTGNDTLNITSVRRNAPQYTITPTSGSLAPYGSMKFYVTFTPTAGGTVLDTVYFYDNASGSPQKVPLSGAAPLFTEQYAGSITGVDYSTVDWGDYDNDGKLDFLLTGHGSSGIFSKIYRNTGSGFTVTNSLPGVMNSSTAWGDYDNDGKLDILITGYTGSMRVAKIFRNTGSGFTERYGFPGVLYGSVAWGDYDNDGKSDFLMTGHNGSIEIAKIYRNTGSGFTEVYSGLLPGVYDGSVAWGDYNNDGKLDILMTGFTGSIPIAKIYRNTGSGFTEVFAGLLSGVRYSSVAWGDYDNDGKLDILLTGDHGGSYIAKLYRNTGSGFTEVYPGSLTGVRYSSVAWGDYDNDGNLDILLTGHTGTTLITKIYRNTGSGFTDVTGGLLTGVYTGSVAWGDYDNDGKLDFLVTGNNGSTQIAKLYKNNNATANTVPLAPAGLSATVANDTVHLHWDQSTDSETPTPGLSYNLYLGTTPSGVNVQSPMADVSTGWRRIVELGSADEDTAWTVENLPNGTYYWSVQAVDHAFAGSPFATEGSFSLMPSFIPAPTTFTFDAVIVGTSRQDSITVTNTGNDTLIITGVITGDLQYSVTPTIGSIIPSGSMKFYVTFTPTAAGTVVDAISFTNNASGSPHEIPLTGNAILPTISVDVQAKWNIVSVPLQTVSMMKGILYPTATTNAFCFAGGYVVKDTLELGCAYWMKFNGSQSVNFTGMPLNTMTTDVQSGWNMIGSVMEVIPIGAITSDPPGMVTSQFFGYQSGYSSVDSIHPGLGYWVKVAEAGELTLGVPDDALAKTTPGSFIRIIASKELPPPPPESEASNPKPQIPNQYGLDQNYPNPFNPLTVIRYQLPVDSWVTLKVYNTLGKEVVRLVDGLQDAGSMQLDWNASDLTSGIYFYRIDATSITDPAKSFNRVRKMILIK